METTEEIPHFRRRSIAWTKGRTRQGGGSFAEQAGIKQNGGGLHQERISGQEVAEATILAPITSEVVVSSVDS